MQFFGGSGPPIGEYDVKVVLWLVATSIGALVACGGTGKETLLPAQNGVPEDRAAELTMPVPVPTLGLLSPPQAGPVEAMPSTDAAFVDAVLSCNQDYFLTGKPACYGTLVQKTGPAVVLQALAELIRSGELDSFVDTHDFAHVVGRQTARVFGINGEAFLRCSTEFNYGCQHGFFEQALASSPSAVDAASDICADLVDTHPSKTVFYCYHGVGHGVMMASAYDLDVALSTCDSFGDRMASDGCWQGVFMENVNAVMRGEAREGVFSDADPLAPCSRVAERHKWECYINHAGRLITLFQFSVGEASQACLAASSGFVPACIQSLGLMVSNPAWQLTLAGPESRSRNLEVTVELCGRFPADYRLDCVIGAVDNILNFDGVVLDRALRYCGIVEDAHREPCYVRIGVALQSQVTDPASRSALCQAVEEPYRTRCLEGAGVVIAAGGPAFRGRPSPEGVAPQPTTGVVGANERGRTPSPAAVGAEPSVEVLVDEGGFAPETVVIQAGDTVRWRNVGDDFMWPASNDHPTHELYGGFDALRPIGTGETWSFTFERRGVWGYHNHMSSRSTGTVIVE